MPNKSPEPLALAVPLSRFTSRVGGGSAFFVRRQDAHKFMTPAMQKIFGVMICLFAMIRLVSHPAAKTSFIEYVLMAVMFACGIYLFFAKKPQGSDKK
jgi:hypothetical protein